MSMEVTNKKYDHYEPMSAYTGVIPYVDITLSQENKDDKVSRIKVDDMLSILYRKFNSDGSESFTIYRGKVRRIKNANRCSSCDGDGNALRTFLMNIHIYMDCSGEYHYNIADLTLVNIVDINDIDHEYEPRIPEEFIPDIPDNDWHIEGKTEKRETLRVDLESGMTNYGLTR